MINTEYNKTYIKRKRTGIALSILTCLVLSINLVLLNTSAAKNRVSSRRAWSKVERNSNTTSNNNTSSSDKTVAPTVTPTPPPAAPTSTPPAAKPTVAKKKTSTAPSRTENTPVSPPEPSKIERVASLGSTNPEDLQTTKYAYKSFTPATTKLLEAAGTTAIGAGVIAIIMQTLVLPQPAAYRSSFVTVRGN